MIVLILLISSIALLLATAKFKQRTSNTKDVSRTVILSILITLTIVVLLMLLFFTFVFGDTPSLIIIGSFIAGTLLYIYKTHVSVVKPK